MDSNSVVGLGHAGGPVSELLLYKNYIFEKLVAGLFSGCLISPPPGFWLLLLLLDLNMVLTD